VECEGDDGNGALKKKWLDAMHQCNIDQGSFETASCAYTQTMETACAVHGTCFSNAADLWDAETTLIKSDAESRVASFEMVQRIRCFLEVFSKAGHHNDVDQAEVDKCKSSTHDTSQYNLPITGKPAEPEECAVLPKPCSQDWTDREYSNTSDAPLATCTPCPAGGGSGGGAASGPFTGLVQQGTYLGCIWYADCYFTHGQTHGQSNFDGKKNWRADSKSPVTYQSWEECRDLCSQKYDYFGFKCQGHCHCFTQEKYSTNHWSYCLPDKPEYFLEQFRCQAGAPWNRNYVCDYNAPTFIEEPNTGRRLYFGTEGTIAAYCANPSGCELKGEGAPGDDGSTQHCVAVPGPPESGKDNNSDKWCLKDKNGVEFASGNRRRQTNKLYEPCPGGASYC